MTQVEGLNPPQRQAALHAGGPLLVFAGAGSGKTRTITFRIANLLATHRVPPYRILAVTFTNKAAQEMRHRLAQLVGEELTRDLWVGTFHGVCAKFLRRYHDAVGLTRRDHDCAGSGAPCRGIGRRLSRPSLNRRQFELIRAR